MDNGRGQRKISAKELTAEIDQATDLALVAEQAAALETSREQVEKIGRQALGNGDVQARIQPHSAEIGAQAIYSTVQVDGNAAEREAARELAQDEDKLEHSVDYVGTESSLQRQERQAGDQENLKNELDPKRDFEAEIASRGQEELAREAMAMVDDLLKEKQVSPAELERVWRRMGDAVLGSYEVPHLIGMGNG